MLVRSKRRLRVRGRVFLEKGEATFADPVPAATMRVLRVLLRRRLIEIVDAPGAKPAYARPARPIAPDHVALKPVHEPTKPAVEIPEGMCAACPVLPPAPPGALVPCVACFVRAGYTAEAYARQWPQYAPTPPPVIDTSAIQHLYVEGRIVVDDAKPDAPEIVERTDTMPLEIAGEGPVDTVDEPPSTEAPKKKRGRPPKPKADETP